MIRIAIAETDESMRRRLVQALVVDRRLDVVGTASDPAAALELVSRTKPDLIVVDLGMPRSEGLVLIRTILLTVPDTGVVIRQAGCDELAVHEAFRVGATGFLIEDGFDDDITSCIRLLTPAQVQQLRAIPAPRRRSISRAHPIKPLRPHSRARRFPKCDAPSSTGKPIRMRKGTTRLVLASCLHRDNAGQQRRHPCQHQSHHGRGHL